MEKETKNIKLTALAAKLLERKEAIKIEVEKAKKDGRLKPANLI